MESNHRRRPNTPLTKGEINRLKAGAKPLRRADGQGLYIQVETNGAKHWRMAYRIFDPIRGRDVQKTLAFGTWPDVDIEAARTKRKTARDELRAGRDPGGALKGVKTIGGATFGDVAAEVLAKLERENRAPKTISKNRWLLEKLAAPLKDIPIAELQEDVPRIFKLCEGIADSNRRESAIRLRGAIGGVFKRAINTGRAKFDPTVTLANELPQPVVQHHAGLTDPKRVGRLLLAIDAYPESKAVGLALKLAPYVFVRPYELRAAKWPEFDFREACWTIPAERTKVRRQHIVPLAPQAVAILREVQKLTGPDGFVFPSFRTPKKCMSEGTLKAALALIGYDSDVQTPHGFRSTASTMIHKARKWERPIVEFQLQHVPLSAVEGAYDHNQWIEERTEIMLWWGNELDRLRKRADQDIRFGLAKA